VKSVVSVVESADRFIVEQTHFAIKEGDRNSWIVADNYLKFSTIGWTQQQIADEFKCSQASVSKFTACAEKYSLVNTRPRFWDAFSGFNSNPRTLGTGQDEWYTPPEYIQLIHRTLGAIDLDPASCLQAQDTVRAGAFFSESQNGLERNWWGRVFMNPPYSQPKINQFIEKLLLERASSRVTEAIVLTTNNTDTDWFQSLAHGCSALCFTDGRVKFLAPDGRKPAPNQGHVFTYLGESPEAFEREFEAVGVVFRAR